MNLYKQWNDPSCCREDEWNVDDNRDGQKNYRPRAQSDDKNSHSLWWGIYLLLAKIQKYLYKLD